VVAIVFLQHVVRVFCLARMQLPNTDCFKAGNKDCFGCTADLEKNVSSD